MGRICGGKLKVFLLLKVLMIFCKIVSSEVLKVLVEVGGGEDAGCSQCQHNRGSCYPHHHQLPTDRHDDDDHDHVLLLLCTSSINVLNP